jgi:gallate decarboxylase subunit D
MNKEEMVVMEGDGALEVSARVIPAGRDMLIYLTGGQAHIGAVAVGVLQPDDEDLGDADDKGWVFRFPGHKEYIVAKPMAERLSKAYNCNVVIVAGMHWDKLSEDEIQKVIGLCERIELKIRAEWQF